MLTEPNCSSGEQVRLKTSDVFFLDLHFLQATCHNSQVTSSYHEYCCTGAEVGQQIGTLLLVGVAAQGREGGPFWVKFFWGKAPSFAATQPEGGT